MTMLDSEKERNRVLRRADWRFLLPSPTPARSTCSSGGPIACAVQAISLEFVPPGQSDADCDLAAAVNPDRETLRRAWEALRPGGSLYLEWSSLRGGRLPALSRMVEEARFGAVEAYWAYPFPAHAPAAFWLPLNSLPAQNYFFAHRPRDQEKARQLARQIQQAAWRRLARFGFVGPVSLIARKPGTGVRADPLSEWLRDASSELPRVSRLLLTGGHRAVNKPVMLVFARNEKEPRLAIKHARVPEAEKALVQEAANLERLAHLRPDLRGVPRVLFCEHSPSARLGETIITGTPLYAGLSRRTARDVALKATDWLLGLAGSAEVRPRAEWWGRLVEPLLSCFAERYAPVLEPGFLVETRRVLDTLDALPSVPEQRDFSPWNVIVQGDGALGVLDWESAELYGLPARDVIYFLAYLAFFIEGALEAERTCEAYRELLEPSTFMGSIFAECLARYGHGLGLDPSALRPLRMLTWLLHSQSEYMRQSEDSGGRIRWESLRKSLFLNLLREEIKMGRT